ncbi:(pine wood nematode) hypothetical protein [Aphelenchoides fujianensis]|nr:(pine wood nematode) hypothetical protein [Aphelenchoides fujianensis]
MIFLVVLFVLFGLLVWWEVHGKRRHLPPGPFPLPALGNSLSLAACSRYEEKFLEWRDAYGPLYTYWLGEQPIVAVCDADLAKRMFVDNGGDYVGRPTGANFQRYVKENKKGGVIFAEGLFWVDQRRFAIRTLRDMGLAKHAMEERILEEIQTISENIRRDIECGVDEHDVHRHIDIGVGNVINNLIFGLRYTQDGREAEFYRVKELTGQIMACLTHPIVVIARYNDLFFSLTRRLFSGFYRPFQELFDFLEENVRERIQQFESEKEDGREEARDLVDAFLIEKARLERQNAPNAAFYTPSQLVALAMDIWFAGQETTATTLMWAIGFLIAHPDAQRRLQEELDRVVGRDRVVSVADRPNLPFTNAVIMEVQRTANIIAQNVFRRTVRDVEVDGRRIPKGALYIAQISAIHYDPKVFEKPTEFRPERFLDASGQVRKCDELLPFSLGKRLFLFVANLFHQFEFLPGKKPPELRKFPSPGATACTPFKCRLSKRSPL